MVSANSSRRWSNAWTSPLPPDRCRRTRSTSHAQTGLGPGIEAFIEALEDADDAFSTGALEAIEQFEQDTGVDLILDLAANIAGMQVFALGNLIDYPEPTGIEYVLFETQAEDERKLRRDLTAILEYVEDELCDCDTDLAVDTEGGFVPGVLAGGGRTGLLR